jgi:hypothetical protein
LDKCVGFSELLFEERSILGITPVEMHLKSVSDKLAFVTKPFQPDPC